MKDFFKKNKMFLFVVLTLLAVPLFFGAWRQVLTARVLKVVTIEALNSNETLTITSPTITSPTLTTTGGVTATNIADVERLVHLPLGAYTTNGEDVDAATAPGFELDDSIPGIVWADGEVTPVTISFPIPADYSSGGAFRLICKDSDADATPVAIDFDVFVNEDGVAIDSTGTNQTAVSMTATAGSTPEVVTLTPATDFASLAAGQWVTFRFWRDDTATGTSDLEVFGTTFYYTATQ